MTLMILIIKDNGSFHTLLNTINTINKQTYKAVKSSSMWNLDQQERSPSSSVKCKAQLHSLHRVKHFALHTMHLARLSGPFLRYCSLNGLCVPFSLCCGCFSHVFCLAGLVACSNTGSSWVALARVDASLVILTLQCSTMISLISMSVKSSSDTFLVRRPDFISRAFQIM